MAQLTGTEIIARFQLQVDDSSELSTDEELDLLNEVYNDIADDREWEWLRKTATGTTSVSVPYIALPSDFKNIVPNRDGRSVVFVGSDFREYEVVPYSARRDYRDQSGICYIDIPNFRLYFTLQPTSAETVEYEYIHRPTAILAGTSPLFKGKNEIIAYGMAAKFNPMELSEKSSSYRIENLAEYRRLLSELATEDALIKLSI